jgi:hypothetical protein
MDYNNINTERGIMPPASVASRRHKMQTKTLFKIDFEGEKRKVKGLKRERNLKPTLGKCR